MSIARHKALSARRRRTEAALDEKNEATVADPAVTLCCSYFGGLASALFINNRWLASKMGTPSMFVPLHPYTSS
jgi:hypothetical protein